jgi:hypothetical protein
LHAETQARALAVAHQLEKVVKMDYRKAAEMAALSAEKMDDYPMVEELSPGRSTVGADNPILD